MKGEGKSMSQSWIQAGKSWLDWQSCARRGVNRAKAKKWRQKDKTLLKQGDAEELKSDAMADRISDPYTNRATAAQDIQSAVDASADGDTVIGY